MTRLVQEGLYRMLTCSERECWWQLLSQSPPENRREKLIHIKVKKKEKGHKTYALSSEFFQLVAHFWYHLQTNSQPLVFIVNYHTHYTCTDCVLLCIDYSAKKQTKGRNQREVRVEDDSFVKIYAAVIVFLQKEESMQVTCNFHVQFKCTCSSRIQTLFYC